MNEFHKESTERKLQEVEEWAKNPSAPAKPFTLLLKPQIYEETIK
ncbi:MAG TPA: hypothetical protein PK941_06580 [Paludibacter sp.]|nr:hypothetical protein [Paludibacter sp.]